MAVEAGMIGSRLRAGREKMSLTVLQVAERIHTDPKVVEAVEAENFAALGAPVYARGHIRHYAELVGESADELTGLYSKQTQVEQPDLTKIVKVPSADESNRLVAPALVVIAVFAVAGAIWWVSALSKKQPQLSETHVVGEQPEAPPVLQGNSPDSAAAPAGQSAPQSGAAPGSAGESPPAPVTGGTPTPPGSSQSAATEGTPAPAAGEGSTRAPVVAPTQPSAGSTRPRAPAPASARTSAQPLSHASSPDRDRSAAAALPPPQPQAPPVSLATRVASAASRPSGSGSAATANASGTPGEAASRSKSQAQVTLHYSADSWTEVYDATGARLYYDVGAANSTQTVVGTPPLRVVLGNASGVSVDSNGHSTPTAKFARPDGSAQFSINRSGRVFGAKPVTDGG